MSETAAMDVADRFYEHKNEELLIADGNKLGVSVKLTEASDTHTSYTIGNTWLAILYRKPGKPVAVTLRPILKA